MDQAARIDVVVKSEMKKRAIPGLQAVVIRHGRVVYDRAFGVADLESNRPVVPTTIFTLNSSTKAFTGVAIMQLVERGKLSLSAPASRYLEGLPAAWRNVTIAQLLTHVSGLPDVIEQPKGQGTGSLVGDGTEDSAWKTVTARPIEAPAGQSYRYNQTNYVILGKIIQRVSGVPFDEFMRTRQFTPAAMRSTAFGDSRTIMPGRSRLYRYVGGSVDGPEGTRPLEHAFDEFSPFVRTAGGLNASAEDLARWLIALQNGTLLSPTAVETMWSPGHFNNGHPTPWGMGWPLSDHGGHLVAAGIGGRRTAFFVYPHDDLAVIVLTNLAGANPEEFVDEIAGQFLPDLLEVNGGGLPMPVKRLRLALMESDFKEPLAAYRRLEQKDATFAISESELNAWGGVLLNAGHVDQAIAVFSLNVSLTPGSSNAHDSLGEGYEAKHAFDLAIASYTAAVALDSTNEHARSRLKALEARQ
ncbi:CubicO group peptidase, beta-lactamase class C family [Luteibacter sp. UNCMF331Sha3.1]|nr:CubicO group peptidase, beta-lactamase class C family [Luteibacter sp. UNCMF331Sha3.1]